MLPVHARSLGFRKNLLKQNAAWAVPARTPERVNWQCYPTPSSLCFISLPSAPQDKPVSKEASVSKGKPISKDSSVSKSIASSTCSLLDFADHY